MNVAELNKYLRAKLLAKNIAKFYQKHSKILPKRHFKILQKTTKFYKKTTQILPKTQQNCTWYVLVSEELMDCRELNVTVSAHQVCNRVRLLLGR